MVSKQRLAKAVCLGVLFYVQPAWAQRASENAVKQAQDGFGFSVGGETIGLYTTDSVRGFSPAAAGNVRMEGLYIDRQGYFSGRLTGSSTVRVGVNTLGYLFAAPSGVADFSVRKTGDGVSLVAGLGDYRSPYVEIDGGVTAQDGEWSLGGGVGLHVDENNFRGGDSTYGNLALVPRWRPSDRFELMGYVDRERGEGFDVSPVYYTAGPYRPPRLKRGVNRGQAWAEYAYRSQNEGVIGKVDFGGGWRLRTGLFHSVFNPKSDAFDLISNIAPDGRGERLLLLVPERRFASVSGEAQLERSWTTAQSRHTLTAMARGRRLHGRYGGEKAVALGAYRLNETTPVARPDIVFDNPQKHDRVRQLTGGLNYRLEWGRVLDLSVGVQKSRYEKIYAPGGGQARVGRSDPWLYNMQAAWRVDGANVIYASRSRGLEESGAAPENAVNYGEVLPAIETTQSEAGVRSKLGPLTLTSAVFDLRRPYAALDAADRFGFVGQVRHRGIEASLAGSPAEGLSVVAGLLLLQPRISGREVEAGLRGVRPVGQTPLALQASADYSPSRIKNMSFDAALSVFGERTARPDNQADLPARGNLNLGVRYRFKAFDRPSVLRAQVLNVFDTYGLSVSSAGSYDYVAGRRWRLFLTTDF